MSGCKTCSKPLGQRNRTGYCGGCVGRHNIANPETRAKISRSQRRRFMVDPEAKRQAVENVRKAHASPKALAERKARWAREKPWIEGNACRPAGSEARLRAGRQVSATKLAWCPPHLREQYRYLTQRKRMKAAEARRMIEELEAAELARWRREHGYEQPREVEAA